MSFTGNCTRFIAELGTAYCVTTKANVIFHWQILKYGCDVTIFELRSSTRHFQIV